MVQNHEGWPSHPAPPRPRYVLLPPPKADKQRLKAQTTHGKGKRAALATRQVRATGGVRTALRPPSKQTHSRTRHHPALETPPATCRGADNTRQGGEGSISRHVPSTCLLGVCRLPSAQEASKHTDARGADPTRQRAAGEKAHFRPHCQRPPRALHDTRTTKHIAGTSPALLRRSPFSPAISLP